MKPKNQIFWTQIDYTLAESCGFNTTELANRIAKMQREACRYDTICDTMRFAHFQGKEYAYIMVETTWPLYDEWIGRLKKMYPGLCDFRFNDEMDDE